jgi:hypothetical protein
VGDLYAFPGVVGGLAGTWLFLVGFLVSLGASIRAVAVRRQPGKGHVARGLVAGGGVLGLAGLLLYAGAQASPWREAFDRGAPAFAVVGGIAASLVTRAAARRAAARPLRPRS